VNSDNWAQLICGVEQDCSLSISDRAERLKKLLETMKEDDADPNLERLQFIVVALDFRTPHGIESGWRFGPMLEWDNGFKYPDIQLLLDPAWQVYREELVRTPSCAMRARYADLLWEKERQQDYARQAFHAYHEMSKVILKDCVSEGQFGLSLELEMVDGLRSSAIPGGRCRQSSCWPSGRTSVTR
jgi:hypothetical protein